MKKNKNSKNEADNPFLTERIFMLLGLIISKFSLSQLRENYQRYRRDYKEIHTLSSALTFYSENKHPVFEKEPKERLLSFMRLVFRFDRKKEIQRERDVNLAVAKLIFNPTHFEGQDTLDMTAFLPSISKYKPIELLKHRTAEELKSIYLRVAITFATLA